MWKGVRVGAESREEENGRGTSICFRPWPMCVQAGESVSVRFDQFRLEPSRVCLSYVVVFEMDGNPRWTGVGVQWRHRHVVQAGGFGSPERPGVDSRMQWAWTPLTRSAPSTCTPAQQRGTATGIVRRLQLATREAIPGMRLRLLHLVGPCLLWCLR
jgi:hypothetical protein